MMQTNGKFYLGRLYDPQAGQVTDQPLLYEPADLTTHAVVVGMTGSGKTGLCLDLLEEAALQRIPALMIDPKGDITNALLHFPNLLPQDFQPWVNADQARREGKSVEQMAAQAAEQARKGLAEWDIPPERVRALQNAAEFTIYTPGSDAGIPVNILTSLKCPPIPWQENREILRENISGTAIALLGLVGLEDIDPVRSREHILLANIFEYAWSRGQDLDLGELILQVQTPPFQKLGVFDVNTFFPEKDRFELAMLLNNILAAPAFQSWIEGQPLDIPSLLTAPDGRPRHSVFYIAHLPDAERMFFVTLLFAAVETWMRSQTGTPSLRALVYFDEIYGYLPPIRNPPSKQPMLRLLKQARAFGVGLVFVTQNPVDMDYKALSNAGTWFIGKLQTEQDKQRLLDGLESAMPGSLERAVIDRLISTLGKRVFVLNNVHDQKPVLFQTRWSMNYMAGPLTRAQIPALRTPAERCSVPPLTVRTPVERCSVPPLTVRTPAKGGLTENRASRSAQPEAGSQPALAHELLTTRAPAPIEEFQPILVVEPPQSATVNLPPSMGKPTLPPGVREYVLPNNLTFTQAFTAAGRSFPPEALSLGLIYRPVLLAQVGIRFLNRKYNLDTRLQKTILVKNPDRRGVARWEDFPAQPVDPAELDETPDPQGTFTVLEAPFTEAKIMAAMQKDFLDWAYRTAQVAVRANEALKLYAGPEVSSAEFHTLCADMARQGRDAELRKVGASFDTKLRTFQEKKIREERELAEDKTELSQRKVEELGTHAENFLGVFGGRRRGRLSSSLSKHRMTEQAKADVEESVDAITDFRQQIEDLEAQREQALSEISATWGELAAQLTEIPITPYKKDVLLDLFGVAWMPYHVVKVGEEVEELPGYGA